MKSDPSPLAAIALLAAAYVSYMVASVSARLGAVVGMRRTYRLGYVGAALIALAGLSRLALDFRQPNAALRTALHDVPLAAGALMVIVIAWTYWGWLIHER
ncbi:MAG: hypothetical protein HPY83_05275 [Anaerolineae bacterium]|nr:hypothetical protein [Anaerolineae bacterium]